MVAGVKPHDLDVQISRDMITITGSREEIEEIEEKDYYHRELFWGSFSRNILLPEEIDVEESAAEEKHGMLEIHLPKIDKNKKTKLQVKSG
jgi:HSP20 family protein